MATETRGSQTSHGADFSRAPLNPHAAGWLSRLVWGAGAPPGRTYVSSGDLSGVWEAVVGRLWGARGDGAGGRAGEGPVPVRGGEGERQGGDAAAELGRALTGKGARSLVHHGCPVRSERADRIPPVGGGRGRRADVPEAGGSRATDWSAGATAPELLRPVLGAWRATPGATEQATPEGPARGSLLPSTSNSSGRAPKSRVAGRGQP